MASTPHTGTGTSVTWRGSSIGEVSQIRYLAGGGLPIGRVSPFAVDAGTVEIASYGTVSPAQYGMKGTLAVASELVSVTTKAVCLSVDIGATVNDVWRYKTTFRIVKE